MAVVAVAAAVATVVIQLTKIIIDLHRHFGSATSPCASTPLSPLYPYPLPLCSRFAISALSKSIVAKIYVQNLTLPIGRFVGIFLFFFSFLLPIVVQTVAFPSSSTCVSLSVFMSLRLPSSRVGVAFEIENESSFALLWLVPPLTAPARYSLAEIYALLQLFFLVLVFFEVFFPYFTLKSITRHFDRHFYAYCFGELRINKFFR